MTAYTVSLTLTVHLDIAEGCEISPIANPEIRREAWKEFQRRYESGDYDGDVIDVEVEDDN